MSKIENNTTNKNKKMSGSAKLKIIIVLGVLIYTIIMMINQQATINDLLERKNELLAEKASLEADKAYYQNEYDYMGTDTYIIKEAKDRLGWILEGETKYIESDS